MKSGKLRKKGTKKVSSINVSFDINLFFGLG